MERKKEKILMQSMRRKQQQEELRQRKEQEALQRKEEERAKEEEKQRKKEDEKARRAIIFEQYKIKKAMEEAEKEVRHCHVIPRNFKNDNFEKKNVGPSVRDAGSDGL